MEVDAGLDSTGPARDTAGPDVAAQDTVGPDAVGRDSTGRDSPGRDSPGRDSTGRPNPGPDGSGRRGAEFSGAGSRHRTDTPDLSKLAQDWITLWQSELSAMAADPELQESFQTMIALWAGTMAAMLRDLPSGGGAARRERPGSGAADAAGAAPVAAAPDPRDAAIERLTRHVTALERRLAELERGDNPAVDPKRRPGRKQRR